MIHESPEITVVVCTYNVERYLSKALDSILSQTYPKVSILVIDDGSNDSTPKIIEEYVVSNPSVSFIHNKHNQGTAAVRQQGLELTKTDYMMFFDADDIALPELIEKQVAKISGDDRCIAVGVYAHYIGPDDDFNTLGSQAVGVTSEKDFFKRYRGSKLLYSLPYTLFKREFALKAGGYRKSGFDEYPQLRLQDISEDVDLWTRMSDFGRDGKYMITIPEELVLYRKMSGTLSATNIKWMSRKLRWIKDCVERRRSGLEERKLHEYLNSLSFWQRCFYYKEDLGNFLYKSATFKVLEKRYFRAMFYMGLTLIFSPGFLLKKIKNMGKFSFVTK